MTAVDVDALDKLREAATAGPWERGGYQVVSPGGVVAETHTTDDATLIVATVNALPDLIAEASKYWALREAVLAEAEGMDQELADRGILLDRVIPPGDRLRAVVATVDGER